MNYKIFEKKNDTFFKYSPTKKFKKITTKKSQMKIHLKY